MNDDEPLEEQFRMLAKYVEPKPNLTTLVMERVRRNTEKPDRAGYLESMKRWAMLPVPRFTVGASLVAGLIVAAVLWLKPDVSNGIAFADVQEALRRIETAVIVCQCHERSFWDHRVYYQRDSDLTVHEWKNGVVHVDDGRGKTLILNTRTKVARYSGGAPSELTSREYLDRLTSIEDDATGRLGGRAIDGQKLVGFVLKPRATQEVVGMARTEVWVDPTTRLPVREEFLPNDPDDIVTGMWRSTCFYTFNVPVDQSLFRMTPPEGYRMLEGAGLHHLLARPHAELPDDPDLAAPTVDFLRGIGPARFGMKFRDVLDVLGRPDEMNYGLKFSPEVCEQLNKEFDGIYKEVARRVKEENLDALEEEKLRSRMLQEMHAKYQPLDVSDTIYITYSARGLSLVCEEDHGLLRVFCESPESNLYGGFRGATTKGIAIGSSVEEIEKAYGPADIKRIADDGSGGLMYVSLAAQFQIEDGRLHAFDFDKDAKTGGYDTIKLDEKK
ncbi:MAG: hypothetical protein GXX96_11960 [Planctomycetaceae bacterium]|nr:hypothetical protein [Planctomycetaceae bacterium]